MRHLLSVLVLGGASILAPASAMACMCPKISPEANIRIPDIIADVEIVDVRRVRFGKEDMAVVRVAKGWKGAREGEYLLVREPISEPGCSNEPILENGTTVRMALTLKKNNTPSDAGYLRVHCYFFNPPERAVGSEQLEKIRQNEKTLKLGARDSLDGDSRDSAGDLIDTLEEYRNAWSKLENDAKREPNSFQSQFNLAKFLIAWHDYRNALPALRKAVTLNSENHEARKLLQMLRAKLDS